MSTRKRLIKPAVAAVLIAASVVYAAMQPDFGEKTEQGLKAQSRQLFGFNNPLAAGLYVHILSQPQLYIEGNHRTGALMMSYILARDGKLPFVLSVDNA